MTRTTRTWPMAMTILSVVAALMLAPITSAAAAEPLPTGTYEVTVADGDVAVSVAEDGSVSVAAADGLVVELQFDEEDRVLDTFLVTAGDTVHEVEVEVADDGTYTVTVTAEEAEEGEEEVEEGNEDEEGEPTDEQDDDEDEQDDSEGHGEIVSMVARCAPAGLQARVAGWPNHGTIVSAAASGAPLDAVITDPETGETTPIEADFTTLAGAEAFCSFVAENVPTAEEVRQQRAEERAEAKAERDAQREARKGAQADDDEADGPPSKGKGKGNGNGRGGGPRG